MSQTYINELKDHIGESVTLKGWLYNKRSSGKLAFLQLRDGTGIVQCVVFKPNDEALFELANSIVQNTHDYPITPKEHGTEFLMDNRHLWIRSKKQHAVLKIRHSVIKATRDFFDNLGFTLADTP